MDNWFWRPAQTWCSSCRYRGRACVFHQGWIAMKLDDATMGAFGLLFALGDLLRKIPQLPERKRRG